MAQPDPTSAFAPAETWFWNGLALSQPFWNITTFGGARYNLPTLRGQNYQVPYRAGQLNRQKFPDQRTVTLNMWVDGSKSSDGTAVGDPRLNFNNKWQQLRQALWTRNATGSVQGQLGRHWFITQSGVSMAVPATAMAEIAGSMDPVMNGRLSAVASLDFLLSDPYFYGVVQSNAISGSGVITNPGEGVAGEGFASAVNQFTVTITNPCTVTNSTAGVSFTYAGGGSFPITIDVLNDTAIDNAGVNQVGNITHAGARLWMCLLNGDNAIACSAGIATFNWNPPYT